MLNHLTVRKTNERTNNTLRGASKLHTWRQADKWASSARARGKKKREKEARRSLRCAGRLCWDLAWEKQMHRPVLQFSAAEWLDGRETWHITSSKENTSSGYCLNATVQPTLSVHPANSRLYGQAEPHGAVQNVCSNDCSYGTIRCFPATKRHLCFAVRSSEAKTDKEIRQHKSM